MSENRFLLLYAVNFDCRRILSYPSGTGQFQKSSRFLVCGYPQWTSLQRRCKYTLLWMVGSGVQSQLLWERFGLSIVLEFLSHSLWNLLSRSISATLKGHLSYWLSKSSIDLALLSSCRISKCGRSAPLSVARTETFHPSNSSYMIWRNLPLSGKIYRTHAVESLEFVTGQFVPHLRAGNSL